MLDVNERADKKKGMTDHKRNEYIREGLRITNFNTTVRNG
jgi:hypothetical protein